MNPTGHSGTLPRLDTPERRDVHLVIGNRNYSSWSLRAWLALRWMDMAFEVERLPLRTPAFRARMSELSGAAQVPVLVDGDLVVADSLAICEYAAERSGRGWPEDVLLRARARSAVAEMHAGFAALRDALPMNIRARRRVERTPDVERDIERIVAIWCEALTAHDGRAPGLFGAFGIADAFFAPVALRFRSYGVAVPELCGLWLESICGDPALREWCAAAADESEVLEEMERGTALPGPRATGPRVET